MGGCVGVPEVRQETARKGETGNGDEGHFRASSESFSSFDGLHFDSSSGKSGDRSGSDSSSGRRSGNFEPIEKLSLKGEIVKPARKKGLLSNVKTPTKKRHFLAHGGSNKRNGRRHSLSLVVDVSERVRMGRRRSTSDIPVTAEEEIKKRFSMEARDAQNAVSTEEAADNSPQETVSAKGIARHGPSPFGSKRTFSWYVETKVDVKPCDDAEAESEKKSGGTNCVGSHEKDVAEPAAVEEFLPQEKTVSDVEIQQVVDWHYPLADVKLPAVAVEAEAGSRSQVVLTADNERKGAGMNTENAKEREAASTESRDEFAGSVSGDGAMQRQTVQGMAVSRVSLGEVKEDVASEKKLLEAVAALSHASEEDKLAKKALLTAVKKAQEAAAAAAEMDGEWREKLILQGASAEVGNGRVNGKSQRMNPADDGIVIEEFTGAVSNGSSSPKGGHLSPKMPTHPRECSPMSPSRYSLSTMGAPISPRASPTSPRAAPPAPSPPKLKSPQKPPKPRLPIALNFTGKSSAQGAADSSSTGDNLQLKFCEFVDDLDDLDDDADAIFDPALLLTFEEAFQQYSIEDWSAPSLGPRRRSLEVWQRAVAKAKSLKLAEERASADACGTSGAPNSPTTVLSPATSLSSTHEIGSSSPRSKYGLPAGRDVWAAEGSSAEEGTAGNGGGRRATAGKEEGEGRRASSGAAPEADMATVLDRFLSTEEGGSALSFYDSSVSSSPVFDGISV